MKTKCKIKREDRVEVTTGKNRGKIGKVIKLMADKKRLRVIVENVNMVVRHTKPAGPGTPGGIFKKEAPLDISNVILLCPKCNEGTRVSYTSVPQVGSDKLKKVRVCKKCQEHID